MTAIRTNENRNGTNTLAVRTDGKRVHVDDVFVAVRPMNTRVLGKRLREPLTNNESCKVRRTCAHEPERECQCSTAATTAPSTATPAATTPAPSATADEREDALRRKAFQLVKLQLLLHRMSQSA